MKKLFFVLSLSVMFLDCSGDNISTVDDDGNNDDEFPKNIEFITLSQKKISDNNMFNTYFANNVIQNGNFWDVLLTQLEALSISIENPNVNFELEQGLFSLFLPDYKVNISLITEYSDYILVNVDYLPDGNIIWDFDYPYHIVKMPKSDKEVVFETELSLPDGVD